MTMKKVLIVDDHSDIRRLLSITLGKEYEIMEAEDGVTALEKIVAFDANARVIMVSALGKQDLVKDALIKGAKNYIVKPLDREKVLERVLMSLKK